MIRKVFPVVSLVILALSLVPAFADAAEPDLIPVKPDYHRATYAPQKSGENAARVQFDGEPTPRQQMYVFWILGKAISYPIDRAEAAIRGLFQKREPRPQPVAEPAPSNPFASLNRREIPPAPPARQGAAAGR